MNSHDILAKHYFDITYLYRHELPLMGWADAQTALEAKRNVTSGLAARWLSWETGRVLQGQLLSRDFPL